MSDIQSPLPVTKPYLITGRKGCGIYERLEIEELQKNPKQFSLFILAYLALQGRPLESSSLAGNSLPEIPLAAQFPELAGIHGLPFKAWIGDPKLAESDFDPKDPKDTQPVPSRFGEYCNHGSVVFPTWHRPYVMAIEQAIGDLATEVAKRFAANYQGASSEAKEWINAARELRFPFWDWAAEKVVQEGLPKVLKDNEVEIVTPKGKEQVKNPLQCYEFQSIPDGFVDEALDRKNPQLKAYFSEWKQTFQYADSTPTPDGSNYVQLDEKIKENAAQIRRQVSDLFTFPDDCDYAQAWDEFSNHTTESLRKMDFKNVCSLEGIHDTMHDVIGGNGHMSNPDYAGFDPIFYLHHCNVDRLLALWEYVYPKYYMGRGYTYKDRTYPFTQARGTYSLVYNSQLIGSTPLAPFRGENEEYWTSDQARFLSGKYYSYPAVDGVKVGAQITDKQRVEARKKLQEYYSVDQPRELRLIKFNYKFPGVGIGYAVVEKYFRIVIIVQAPEFAWNGPYSVKLYYNKDPESADEDVLIGSVAIFARPDRSPCAGCSMRRDAGSTVRSVIPVPISILEQIGEGTREKIVTVFRSGLRASILNRVGTEIGRTSTPKSSVTDFHSERSVPEITLVSSGAKYRLDGEKPGPVEWFNFEHHGKVFEGDKAWKKV